MSSCAPIMSDPRVEAMHAKVAIRVTIRGETKARTRKAIKAVKNAWKHDSTYRRLVKAKKQADKALQSADDKLEEMHREEAKLLAKIQSEITLPNVCTDLILRPKWVSLLNLDLIFASSITQLKITNSLPPPTLLDVIIPQAILSIPALLSIYSAPASQRKCAKLILPPPTNFLHSSLPPLDLTTPDSTPNSTTLNLIESICAEFVIQTTIPTERKTRTKKPTQSLNPVWRRDHRSVKAETQADMAPQSDNERLEEIYREEAILWARKDPETAPPNTFTKLVLRSKWVWPIPPTTPDPGSVSSITPSETANSQLPPPTTTPSPPPLESTSQEPTPATITPNPRIEAIRAKIAVQTQIQTESKSRLKKSTQAVKTSWKSDRRAVKARKQADKTLQNTTDKIAELRCEEMRVVDQLRQEEARALSGKGEEEKVLGGTGEGVQ